MQDFILTAILLGFVMYLAYRRLRRHIKALEDQIAAQRLSHVKLREANRDLLAELKRIEARIDAGDAKSQPSGKPEPEPEPEPEMEERPLYRVVPDEPAIPPPLPDYLGALCDKMAAGPQVVQPRPPEWTDPGPIDIPAVAAPSFFSTIPWHDILKRMHLLPPAKSDADGTAESQLAAWWVIRIGLVLLIIAAVFFGIHVSQHTPPWLRVVTLCLVSVATIGLGARMRGKLEGFGRAIIGGGFALLYFTAFAAFALPATKIIDAPAAGVLAQFAALTAAILWSLWKKDQMVATLTLFLGFVSCGFSHSHDLDRFATLGLVLLAATGAFLFATRGWLTPFLTALVGSWAGFAIFAELDWLRADAPPFAHLMGALVVLTVLFEAGGLVCAARGLHLRDDRLRRWLLLGNTTAAALIGYSVVRMVHPDQLKDFYFIMAALFFTFTVIHHLRTTDRVVTESFFLKSSALLCLGFAAAFSGPVRWLAIAFQAFSLLWTSRRSGSRWIAAGFVLVLAASVGWFWRDLVLDPPAAWRWQEPFRLAGSLYLVFLTVQLALHSRWFPGGIGGTGEPHQNQARGFRLTGSLVIGFSVLALAFAPSFPGRSDPVWFLLLLAGLIGLLSPLLRSGVPCMAAALPLVSCYIAYAVLPPAASQSTAALLLGATLVLAAFGVCEAIRRYWPVTMMGGSWLREAALLAGLATLLPLTRALGGMFSLTGHAGIALFALFPAVACAAIVCRQMKGAHDQDTGGTAWFQSLAGLLVLTGGAATCGDSGFFPAVLALAGLPMLALAARYRSWNIVVAGVFPILGGFALLWGRLSQARPGEMPHDSINLAVLLLISVSIAVVLWKRITNPGLRMATLWGDAMLHGLGVFSIHLFFQKHLGEGPDFLAAAVLGVTLFATSRRFPFRSLAAVSWLPVALACVSGVLAKNWQGAAHGEVWFMAAGVLVLAHLMAAHHSRSGGSSGIPELIMDVIACIAVIAWTLVTLAAAEDPWQAAALTGIALLCAALWRWRAIARIGHFGLGPLTLAFCMAAALMLADSRSPGPVVATLTSLLLTSAGIAANGMIMAAGVRRVLGLKITSASVMPWFHALAALVIAFSACTIDRLVSDEFTAVFWGLSAILLFACGLLAGLRAYRLAGLIGLVFCTGHIFIFDIQDTFYRIIAFFVTGMVMLAIGFLYHRFRERISAMDS
jgi:hypothetical protein